MTAGALIKAWGFFRGPRRVPSDAERPRRWSASACGTSSSIRRRAQVRILRPGLEINLGSIGKGYALDRAAAILRRAAEFARSVVARRA